MAGSAGEAGPTGKVNILIRKQYDKNKVRLTSSQQIDTMLGNSLVVPEDPHRTRTNSGNADQPSGSQSQPPIPTRSSTNNGFSSTQQPLFNVPTSNSFESLTEFIDITDSPGNQVSPVHSDTNHGVTVQKIRCPPIYVYGKSVAELNQLLPAANIS